MPFPISIRHFAVELLAARRVLLGLSNAKSMSAPMSTTTAGSKPLIRLLACIECRAEFRNKAKLQKHANEAQHSPFACLCGKKFARLDVLNRHLDSLRDGMPKYPCSFCKKHRGKDGFRRRDHLLQHIRGYHKFEAEDKIGDILPSRRGRYQAPPVCPHRECSFYRDDSFKEMTAEEQMKNKPFETQSEYTKHMKMVHDYTPFPCTVAGCSKTGKKGYTREKDLVNHRRNILEQVNTFQRPGM
ncbi:CROL alpha [Colletotrichum plurivorum]|uniref:CROL alpha n=1 Tax=Colletotrichum plurivorum TaxID=2175906 RepID=A0A8H6KIB2_9PEZI|nr:CROL alpha [Colletotrichum plurivorum]